MALHCTVLKDIVPFIGVINLNSTSRLIESIALEKERVEEERNRKEGGQGVNGEGRRRAGYERREAEGQKPTLSVAMGQETNLSSTITPIFPDSPDQNWCSRLHQGL